MVFGFNAPECHSKGVENQGDSFSFELSITECDIYPVSSDSSLLETIHEHLLVSPLSVGFNIIMSASLTEFRYSAFNNNGEDGSTAFVIVMGFA